MKLSIDKNAFNRNDPAAADYIKMIKSDDYFSKEEINRMAAFYSGNAYQRRVLETTATVARNGDPLMPDGEVDCWIEMFIEALDACYRIGFYLNDFLMMDYDNHDELKARAYIRKYAATA